MHGAPVIPPALYNTTDAPFQPESPPREEGPPFGWPLLYLWYALMSVLVRLSPPYDDPTRSDSIAWSMSIIFCADSSMSITKLSMRATK